MLASIAIDDNTSGNSSTACSTKEGKKSKIETQSAAQRWSPLYDEFDLIESAAHLLWTQVQDTPIANDNLLFELSHVSWQHFNSFQANAIDSIEYSQIAEFYSEVGFVRIDRTERRDDCPT